MRKIYIQACNLQPYTISITSRLAQMYGLFLNQTSLPSFFTKEDGFYYELSLTEKQFEILSKEIGNHRFVDYHSNLRHTSWVWVKESLDDDVKMYTNRVRSYICGPYPRIFTSKNNLCDYTNEEIEYVTVANSETFNNFMKGELFEKSALEEVKYRISSIESITIKNGLLTSTIGREESSDSKYNIAIDSIEAFLLNLYSSGIKIPDEILIETIYDLANKFLE